MQILLLAAYCSVLVVLCTYGAHRAHLVYQCWRHRRRIQVGERPVAIAEEALPTVTVQLPIFNEATVAARLISILASYQSPKAAVTSFEMPFIIAPNAGATA